MILRRKQKKQARAVGAARPADEGNGGHHLLTSEKKLSHTPDEQTKGLA